MPLVTLRVLDLFSGIGGFSLGLERTGGFETVAFCEIEPYARAVLRKQWPTVPCYDDVRSLTAKRLSADGIDADVICGGFPCQDISTAGKGGGIDAERSGLWREYHRLIGEIRPRYAIVENVAALTFRGLLRVLGDLAQIRYDAEWHCIPACAVGAPHERDRVWIVAHTASERCRKAREHSERSEEWSCGCGALSNPYANGDGLETHSDKAPICGAPIYRELSRRLSEVGYAGQWHGTWPLGTRPLGMDDGLPADVERIRALGNAVVPQVVQTIGEAILEAERQIA